MHLSITHRHQFNVIQWSHSKTCAGLPAEPNSWIYVPDVMWSKDILFLMNGGKRSAFVAFIFVICIVYLVESNPARCHNRFPYTWEEQQKDIDKIKNPTYFPRSNSNDVKKEHHRTYAHSSHFTVCYISILDLSNRIDLLAPGKYTIL